MTEINSNIKSKRQVTIPAHIRRHLGVDPSGKVAFVVTDEGNVEQRPPKQTLGTVLCSIEGLPGESPDLQREIRKATADAARRKVERMARQ